MYITLLLFVLRRTCAKQTRLGPFLNCKKERQCDCKMDCHTACHTAPTRTAYKVIGFFTHLLNVLVSDLFINIFSIIHRYSSPSSHLRVYSSIYPSFLDQRVTSVFFWCHNKTTPKHNEKKVTKRTKILYLVCTCFKCAGVLSPSSFSMI